MTGRTLCADSNGICPSICGIGPGIVQLAAAIRDLGYPARAHIDGNYRVIAPLVARDAGLGEIGRMGLLMTPRWVPGFGSAWSPRTCR